MTDASKRLGAQGWTNGAPPVGQIVEVLQSLDNLSVVRAVWTGEEWRTEAGMLLAGVVRWKPCEKYDMLQVDIKALPFRTENGCTRLWLNGQEIRNVQSVDIAADIGSVTTATLKFHANVAGLD